MEQTQFLEQHIFTGLRNLNDGFGETGIQFFSESDFEIVLQRAEYFGLSIYSLRLGLKVKCLKLHHMKNIKRKQLTQNGTRKNL